MLDIKWIRQNPQQLDKALKNRGAKPLSSDILALDEKRRDLMTKTQELQSRKNDVAKQIGMAKSKGEDASALFEESKKVGPELKQLEEDVRLLDEEFNHLMATIPNVPEEDTPVGDSEDDNVEVRKWGEPASFNFEPKHHFELGENLGLMDFTTGAKLAGSRFVWLQGQMARLERALANYMLDTQTGEHGYTEVIPPYMANDDTLYGTGQLPKFTEDLFKTNEGLWMIPTSEVVLTNYVRGDILEKEQLPLKFTALTPCFRSEAGSAGRDTRGYIRMHQFSKVEMVQITAPESSAQALEDMVGNAEAILQGLGLPYRIVQLCTGDIGFGAKKTYDLEVWLPAQNQYREISSCSNCGDFQARRMQARFRPEKGQKRTEFLHTLNGSGLAVGRTLVAVLENYQEEDGSIRIPEVLKPYMNGQDKIEVKAC